MPEILANLVITVLLLGGCCALAALYGFLDATRKLKVKPRVTICAKCKYVLRKRKKGGHIYYCQEGLTSVDYLTGKVSKGTTSCKAKNQAGACPNFKKGIKLL